MRSALVLILALLAAAPARAEVRLTAEPSAVHALTVASGVAVAVVDSGEADEPYELVRSSGRGRSSIGTFGRAGGEFPDVAADEQGRIFASWLRPVSGGAVVEFVSSRSLGAARSLALATAPAKLAVAQGTALAAFSDQKGDIAVGDEAGAVTALTASAPERRHLPVDVVLTDSGPQVLDLVQAPRRSELRVVGTGAPAAAVVGVEALRAIPSALAADERGVAVAYLTAGRAVLARPAAGTWSRRRLPGPGGSGTGEPAVALAASTAYVAYAQRVQGQREIYVATVRGGTVRTRRLTASPRDDANPVAAAGPAGEVYVAWVRRERGRRVALLERID